MTDPLATINGNKLICTGAGLNYDKPPDLSPQRSTEESFASLISEYYMFFRELIAADVAFLRSVENHQHVTNFDSAVYLLRTARQHQDNPEALTFYEEWVNKYWPWQKASDTLAEALMKALIQLARISGRVRRDPTLTRAWIERASNQPETIFDAVCEDLNASFPSHIKKALIGNVKRRAKRLRPEDDIRANIEDLCAQEITAQVRSLPVPYHAVLDRLGALRTHHARAALLVAYSINASTSLRGEDFLVRVEETWKIASA